jgi:enoyl-CoA hydratase/carnithine racemase
MVVEQDVRGRVLIVTLSRPEKRNAIDDKTASALESALDRLDDDPDLWVGVLTGDGPVFSAGTDLRNPPPPMPRGGEYGVIRRARRTPLIAAVEGAALGGGFEIALACDLVVAELGASFSLPEARRGVVATCGGLFRAAQRLPANLATELLITGGHLTAQRAFDVGFVNRLTGRGSALAEALDLADEICRCSPHSVGQTLQAQRSALGDLDRWGWAATRVAIDAVSASDDRKEGVAAFFERREPEWTGH